MIKLQVSANVDALARQLGAQLAKRLPQTAAQALTRTAFDARDAVRRELPQRFTLRRPWIVQGILAQGATSRELKARVGSRDAFMVWQEAGGSRPGPNAIPLGRLAEQAKSQVIPKREWPRQLLQRRGVFIRRGMILERRGRDARPVWLLKRAQPVRARMGLRQTVAQVVGAQLPKRFGQAWRG